MHSFIFFSILIGVIVANLIWWRHAHRVAGRLPESRRWRIAIGIWCGTMFVVVMLVILSRMISGKIIHWVPQPIVAVVYLWHILFALEWLVWRGFFNAGRAVVRTLRPERATDPIAAATKATTPDPARRDAVNIDATTGQGSTRRQFLTAAAIVAPPVLSSLAAWRAVSQFDQFRVNSTTLKIPNLPPALEGLRIAHVSDIHIGKFTDDALLRAVVERTNALRPDLIVFTGDLIDFDLADLPAGLDILKKWDPKFGLCVCEGNHDLMAGRAGFEDRLLAARFPLPLNDSHSVTVRGQEIQLLGLRWGGADITDPDVGSSERDIADSVRSVAGQLRPGAFPILLAHHPHAFDYLGDADIPLVLSGHTHGGQLNFGPIHPASLRFRYLSGLYSKPNGKQLLVSNGVGNWFPLRINAPAEIGDITLRSV